MAKTRAIRFSDQEEKQIQEFLKMNPFFDFTTFAKVAIWEFVRRPKLNFTPIGQRAKREVKNARAN